MRIGIITIGSRGDVQPYIALGTAFKRTGYEVRLITHEAFADTVREEGLEFADLGVDPRTVMEQVMQEAGLAQDTRRVALFRQMAFMRQALRIAQPLLQKGVQQAWQAIQDVDALVLSVLGVYVGIPFARKRGIPAFAAYVQPLSPTREFPSVLFPPAPNWLAAVASSYNRLSAELVERVRWPMYRGSIGKAVHTFLGTPLRSPLAQMRREHTPTLYGFSRHVLPRPADWPDFCHVTGYWFLDTKAVFQPPADLEAFLQAGSPPVYIGFGSMRGADERGLTEEIIRALQLSGQRGILLTGWGAIKHMPLPETMFAVEAVPHDWLFPRVAAVVHHGGSGTTGAGLRTGLPSLIVPFIGDQFFWGRQIWERGLGPEPIEQTHMNAERLSQAITTMMTDQTMRQRAATVGEHIRSEDGMRNAVRLFEQALRG